MYRPPINGDYSELFTQVYDQGYELAKSGKPFVNPYKINDFFSWSFQGELSSWFEIGYYDYTPENNILKPKKLKKPVVKKKKIITIDLTKEVAKEVELEII